MQSQLPDDVIQALQQGEMIEAIKRLRSASGLGLKEARDLLDRHQAGLPVAFTTLAGNGVGESMPPEVLAAIAEGQVIEAIKRLREARGLGLKEAKDAVEAWMASAPSPRSPSAKAASAATIGRDSRPGLAWIILGLLALVVAGLILGL